MTFLPGLFLYIVSMYNVVISDREEMAQSLIISKIDSLSDTLLVLLILSKELKILNRCIESSHPIPCDVLCISKNLEPAARKI